MTQTERTLDYPPRRSARLILLSALLTGLCLGGSFSFPFWYGLGYYYAPPPVQVQLAGYVSPDNLRDIWQPSVILRIIGL
jgi:hypothetical protein